jgi:hypothetical protein
VSTETRPQTYWNGDPCEARRVRVIVEDRPSAAKYWARPFVGQERNAVEVTYAGSTFYLDDEGYDDAPENYAYMRDAALSLSKSLGGRLSEEQALERMGVKPEQEDGSHLRVGYPGHGWAKVTEGRGSPQYGHSSLSVERVIRGRSS